MKPLEKTILAQIFVCPNMTDERIREIVAALEVIEAVIAEPGGLAIAREEALRMVTRRCRVRLRLPQSNRR